MPNILELELALTHDDVTSTRKIEIEFREDRELLDLTDEQVFLLSESVRTTLIHEDGMLHEMMRELAGKED